MKKDKRNKNKRRPRKITYVTVLQSLYLTGNFYITNDLIAYASACAFGFLFSFIPVVMMILVILIRFLHASPETITSFINTHIIFSDTFNLQYLIDSILSIKHITNFEVVLGLSIIWMARRFFSSVMDGMHTIFKQQLPSRPIATQILILAGEAIIVVLTATIIFGIISFKAIKQNQIFQGIVNAFPHLLGSYSTLLVNIIPLVIIFFVIMVCYKEGSGTKPTWGLCAIASGGRTFSFWVFQRLMGLFININKYNLLYGVLSHVIVSLLEVYFFFMMFLFFAQFLFVCQFFDILLLGELYVLPGREDTHFFAALKRILFIRPDYLMNRDVNVMHLKKNDYIYHKGDSGTDTYYLARGTIEIIRKNNLSFIDRGKFFGEEACILNQARNEDALAQTDVVVVRISGDTFLSLIEKNQMASRKALSQISAYYAKVYGRNDEYHL